jgi:YD repeat-containing protein
MARSRVYRRVRDVEGKLVDRTDAGPGTWYLDYDAAGKRVREATVATTKGEAEALLRKRMSEAVKAELAGVANPKALRLTFKEFVEETFLPHVRATRRPGTVECYERYAVVTCQAFGEKLIRSITKGDVLNYVSDRIRTGRDGRAGKDGAPLSRATINREYSFIRAALYDALSRDLIDRNPAARMELLDEENERDRVMTAKEEAHILERAEPWLVPILRVAVLSGLRRDEILRLKWSEIREGMIHVSAEAKSHEGREVPVTPDLAALLETIDRMVSDGAAVDLVFPGPDGKEIREGRIRAAWEHATRDADVEDLKFHDLRRTFASRLANLGVGLQTISKLLGHGATYVTERYSWMEPGTLRDAVNLLSAPPVAPRTQAPTLKAAGK